MWRVARAVAMSERARQVLAAIRYLEYVTAWAPIPYADRPAYRVIRTDGEWKAVRQARGK